MAVYVTTGKLGSGKSLWAMDKMRQAIRQGRPVATNFDLFLEHLPKPSAPVYRIPDYPKASDLQGIGVGSDSRDEKDFGWLVLDEAGTWLNSREWSSGDRAGVISWLLHARKLHWNVILLVQSVTVLDKQVRESLTEHHVVCRRMDRMRIPFVGNLLTILTLGCFQGNLPKVHMASVRYGLGPSSTHVETEYYQAKDLYRAYDTDQKISPFYDKGLHCMLPPFPQVKLSTVKPKLPAIELAMKLPPDDRVKWASRYLAALDRGKQSLCPVPALAG